MSAVMSLYTPFLQLHSQCANPIIFKLICLTVLNAISIREKDTTFST